MAKHGAVIGNRIAIHAGAAAFISAAVAHHLAAAAQSGEPHPVGHVELCGDQWTHPRGCVSLQLDTRDDAVALTAIDHAPAALATAAPVEIALDQRILAELEVADAPLSATALRKRCQIRNATLQAALLALVANGQLRKNRAGYAVAC